MTVPSLRIVLGIEDVVVETSTTVFVTHEIMYAVVVVIEYEHDEEIGRLKDGVADELGKHRHDCVEKVTVETDEAQEEAQQTSQK